MAATVFEIIPHPGRPGIWIIKPNERIPYALRYRALSHAISYAEWVAKEFENAEIRVYGPGGVLRETLVIKGNSGPRGMGACS